MTRHWGTVRTTEGEVVVDWDGVVIDRSPRKFLAGQFTRSRDGRLPGRMHARFKILFFLVTPALVAIQLVWSAGSSYPLHPWLSYLIVGLPLVSTAVYHFRPTRIPRSAVTEMALDVADRELTLTYETESRVDLLRFQTGMPSGAREFGGELVTPTGHEATVQLTLPSESAVQDARTILGTTTLADEVTVREPGEHRSDGETTYRVETDRGAVFCGRCGRQVSPADNVCSACEYRLRVDASTGTGGQADRQRDSVSVHR
jgi:hypothetical protein